MNRLFHLKAQQKELVLCPTTDTYVTRETKSVYHNSGDEKNTSYFPTPR